MVIGITGGIASGKSTISSLLKELGAFIIDVDMVGREVVQKDKKAYNEIVKYFGYDILLPDGEINRRNLGNIVFSDDKELSVLNSITHPEMVKVVKNRIDQLKEKGEKVIVIDAAVLIEMGLNKYCDSVWLIFADKEVQLNRLMERDRFSYIDALNRIKRQYNKKESQNVDVIINNNRSLEIVKEDVIKLWNKTIKREDEANCL